MNILKFLSQNILENVWRNLIRYCYPLSNVMSSYVIVFQTSKPCVMDSGLPVTFYVSSLGDMPSPLTYLSVLDLVCVICSQHFSTTYLIAEIGQC